MDAANTLTFAFVAALLVMSPGPNGVLIAKTVPTSRRAAGFANVAGFVTGFFIHGALSILGLSILLVQSALAFAIVKYLGAAYLCWIGIKALISAFRNGGAAAPITPARHQRTLRNAFVEGLLTNTLNPKVSMFYLAAFPQFIPTGETSALPAFGLVATHALLNALWFGAMVILFAKLSVGARHPRVQRWLKATTGVVFVGFGAKLATVRPIAP